jgi:hypothetical protein
MSQTTRRRFAQLCGAAAAAPLVISPEAVAQQPAAVAPAETKPLARALTELIRAQWGEHLTTEQLAKIAEDMNDAAPYIERLRKFELRNSDEPDASFSALSR